VSLLFTWILTKSWGVQSMEKSGGNGIPAPVHKCTGAEIHDICCGHTLWTSCSM